MTALWPTLIETLATAPVQLSALPDGHKRCSNCRTIKPLDAFHHKATSKDGYRPICKTCQREVDLARRTRNEDD